MVAWRVLGATWVVLAAAVVTVQAHQQGGAQSSLPGSRALRELTLEELGAVEVIAVSKLPMEVWSTPAAVSVITQQEIARSGATTLPEVLRLAAGVEVGRVDSGHWSIGIRGFGDQFSKSLLVLVDGRKIYTPLFAGTYWPAYDVPLEDIDRIEVVRGPGGTIWGGNAVSGVINVVTRAAAETRGTLVAVGGGSVDLGTLTVRHGGALKGADYRVYARTFARGAQFHPDGSDFDGDQWMGQAGFRVDWTARDRDEFTISGATDRGTHGQRVRMTLFNPPSQPIVDDPVDTRGGHLMATWSRPALGGSLRLQTYYDRTNWQAPHFIEVRDTIDVDYVQSAPIFERHRLSWGAGLRWSPGRFTQTTAAINFDPLERTARRTSAYLQDEVGIVGDKVTLTVGSKFEHDHYTGLELQPSARVLWRTSPTRTVWGAVTRAVRTPSRIERDIRATSLSNLVAAIPIFLQVTGNPAFEAERHIGYEAGFRTLFSPSLYLDAAVFHNEHDGLASFGLGALSIEPTPPPVHGLIQFPFVNGIAGTSSGLEIAPEWRPVSALHVSGSYAFRTFDLHQLPASVDINAVGRYEGSSPRHQTRLQARVSPTARLELDGAYRYVGALDALGVAAYHSADLRLGWRFTPTTSIAVVGQNLLQPHHVEFGHEPGPFVGIERGIWVGVTWVNGPR
jgi:iron complex outermembrane receptor protein